MKVDYYNSVIVLLILFIVYNLNQTKVLLSEKHRKPNSLESFENFDLFPSDNKYDYSHSIDKSPKKYKVRKMSIHNRKPKKAILDTIEHFGYADITGNTDIAVENTETLSSEADESNECSMMFNLDTKCEVGKKCKNSSLTSAYWDDDKSDSSLKAAAVKEIVETGANFAQIGNEDTLSSNPTKNKFTAMYGGGFKFEPIALRNKCIKNRILVNSL